MFVCIGTDRSTGDAYGPIVGTLLREQGRNVIGTLERPCDANAVAQAAEEAGRYKAAVAIDACLGKPGSTGLFLCSRGPLRPGEATAAGLPALGQYSVAGIVGDNGPIPYRSLQTASLYGVLRMARQTAEAVERAWPSGMPDGAHHSSTIPIM